MKIGLFITGLKGELFLEMFDRDVEFVVTYKDGNVDDSSYDATLEMCAERQISVIDRKDIVLETYETVDKIFVIGWQYMLNDCREKIIVLHDSYLPNLKGFCPTPTALIMGYPCMGATAFRPTDDVDEGPLYLKREIDVQYPIKLIEAINLVVKTYTEIVGDIIDNDIKCDKYNEDSVESYSIWRDEEDMLIDWSSGAEDIRRFVDALSYPLGFSRSFYDGRIIKIEEVTPMPDMNFVDKKKHCGKIWNIIDNKPLMLCGGVGMIRIDRASELTGEEIVFNKIRKRMK